VAANEQLEADPEATALLEEYRQIQLAFDQSLLAELRKIRGGSLASGA